MRSEKDNSFQVVLSHREEKEGHDQSKAAVFWEPFLSAARDYDRNSSTELTRQAMESRIRRDFPLRLKHWIKSLVSRGDMVENSERARLADRLIVRVNDISYNSIDVSVSIEPLDALVTLFEGHFEYFEAFLQTYVPIAFREALHSRHEEYYGEWSDIVNQANLSIHPSVGLIQAFGAPRHMQTPLGAPYPDNSKRRNAQWLWIAANTSLVVPTILAAFFLYLGWQTIDKRFAAIDSVSVERMKALLPDKAAPSPTSTPAATPASGAATGTKP
ncbi:hypothetical protein FGA82_25520 [Pseudomonas fluorescens]|uniref:hypothetical protein n=1 Tax=Pseudomonas fluorescens TaxID=294 RepID=UPI0011307050|nr:hypothetical protein [Pseudomonas fluorescens]TMU71866.1 hypothetical protein FGA82_25520 [Pseudomonas fluorescens]